METVARILDLEQENVNLAKQNTALATRVTVLERAHNQAVARRGELEAKEAIHHNALIERVAELEGRLQDVEVNEQAIGLLLEKPTDRPAGEHDALV